MPKLVELSSSKDFNKLKIIEILVPSKDGKGYEHYCDAIVPKELKTSFTLLCAIPIVKGLGKQIFLVKRQGFRNPVRLELSELEYHVRVREKDFGFVHRGRFVE